MDWIDHKYIGILSTRLERFHRTGKSYSFRCPLCGDSQKNKFKTRGYLIEKSKGVLYYCHNCHASMGMQKFMERVDPNMAADYVKDRFTEKYKAAPVPAPVKEQKPDISKIVVPNFAKSDSPLAGLKKISQLAHNHPAKLYVQQRLIPTPVHYKLFYAPKFKAWVNSLIPDKFNAEKDEPRLIIPFLDREGNCYGFQGRSFAKDTMLRYITIMLDESKPKIFGLDTVDTTTRFYVLEGPIDSMFLQNAVAMAGADMSSLFANGDQDVKQNAIMVFDNEPRNIDIVKRIDSCIEAGYNVCIWPTEIHQKDINDMVKVGGKRPTDLQLIIDMNTFSGLEAKLKLTRWKKV